jgi:aminoglycoside phosphotransferase family enzyme/predicted kinase
LIVVNTRCAVLEGKCRPAYRGELSKGVDGLNTSSREVSPSLCDTRLHIDALLDPSQFDYPTKAVRLLETHISWIILTGQFAYKIKKPVNLGFLNFSTLALRKHYCEEELRLNRRLAPQIYLDLVPITGTCSQPRLAGEGVVIDYAVKMREFPQSGLLDRVVSEDGLSDSQVDALAEQIAEFHSRASPVQPEGALSHAESVAMTVDENLNQLQPLLSPAEAGALESLRQWNHKSVSSNIKLFDERLRDGYVRECHGDLHLGNIALVDGKAVIFDCVEFSRDFRCIDQMSDVAFLTMDLDYHAKPALAWRFLDQYLQRTGDYRGLALLRYYQAYRAAVRSKVAAIRMTEAGLGAAAASRKKSEALSRLHLACSYTDAKLPVLIITRGFSGCGKTTITDELLQRLGSIRVRSDVERKRLYGLSALSRTESRVGDGIYSPDSSGATYTELQRLAGAVINAGYSVIVDATFLDRSYRDAFRKTALACGARFKILNVVADERILRERVSRRASLGSDASEATLEVLKQQLKTHDDLSEAERPYVIEVNGGANVDWDDLCLQLKDQTAR